MPIETPGHRTLLAVIEWSRRLLSPAAADALAVLAVFPDGFPVESAGAILRTDPAEVLTELVDQSLLAFVERPGRAARYRMLETVREFGLRDLAEHGRTDAVRADLDAWALAFARRVAPGMLAGVEPALSRVVGDEEETLLAVLRGRTADAEVRTAVGALLAEFWIYRGEFEPIVGMLPSLVAPGRARPASAQAEEERIRALAIASAIAMIAQRPEAARALVLLRRAVGDDPAPAGFWRVLAANLLLSRDVEAGVAALDGMIGHADPMVATFARMMRAQLEENSGASGAAITDLVAAESLAARHGYSWFRFLARTSLASLRSQRGEHARALADARRTRQDLVDLEVDTDLRQLDWLIGANSIITGDLDEGERIFTELLATRGRGGAEDEADNRVLALAGLAEVAMARGDVPTALARWDEATAAGPGASSPWRVVVTASALAGRAASGASAADLARPYRRLRTLIIALHRLQGMRFDAPVAGAGMLGLAAVLRRTDPAAADELAALALAMGARRDMASIDAAAGRVEAAALDGADAAGRAIALLRSPALRLP